jgi:quinol monooxygenase YgiN
MIVLAKLKAKNGQQGKMEKALRDMVSKVSKEEGTLLYTLHRCQGDPTLFMFYEVYKDSKSLKYHSSTPYFKGLFEFLDPLLDGEPEIELYEEIARIR